jgi:diguanylate cyclase (GGDEF)-like protein
LWRSSQHLPDVVFIELVDILFTALLPIISIGIAALAVGAFIASREHDATIFALTLASVLVTVVRILFIFAYRRRRASSLSSADEMRVWERRYAGGSLALGTLIGTLCARAVVLGDPLVTMLVVGLIFGYGSGLVTRVAVRPAICVTSLMLATIPIVMGLCVSTARAGTLSDLEGYAGLTLLVASFAVISLETVAHGYQTTLQQLITKKDLAILAGQDALTGLPNRVLLRARFSEASARSGRTGTLLALHCMDLDRFKAVNDTFGHPTGDALLQAVATRLTRTLQAGDTAARLGGDEFVVVQSGLRHADEARLLAQRIIRVLSAPYNLNGQLVSIGVSIGIAVCPRSGSQLEQAVTQADAALYMAKRHGPGGAVLSNELSAGEPIVTAGKSASSDRRSIAAGK